MGGTNKETEINNKSWLIRIGIKLVDIVEIPILNWTYSKNKWSICFFNKNNILCIYRGKNESLLNDFLIVDLENFIWIKPIMEKY